MLGAPRSVARSMEAASPPQSVPGATGPGSVSNMHYQAPRPLLRLTAAIGAAVFAVLLASTPASAESIVLKSGTKLKAAKVELDGDAVRATLRRDGGTAILTLPFARLDPQSLVALMGRHLPENDGASQLRIGRMALNAALYDEAVERFERAAVLDASLAKESEQGIDRVRALQVDNAIATLETMLRERRPAEMLHDADLLLAGPLATLFSPAQTFRVQALSKLATGMLKNAGVPVGAPKQAQPIPMLGVPAPAPLDLATAAVLEKVSAYETKALHAREGAADPDISSSKARRFLNAAAKSLQQARKLLIKIEAPIPPAVLERAERVRELLVMTYLDVAELYRESGSYTQARARLRAVNILDPDNERGTEIAQAIDEDLRVPGYYESDLYDYPFYTSYGRSRLHHGLYYPGRHYSGRHFGHGHGVHGHYGNGSFHFGISHGGFGFRSHGHYGASHHGHHTRRVVGTRRSR